ncbi:MAG TPA: tryptophan halogenase family protein, partial [Thermoanaerobaculia bacterium]|nr:tryptophan halogenase family protein [Thermoanaerobaculia bacterium]
RARPRRRRRLMGDDRGPAFARDPGLRVEPQPDGRLLLHHRRGRTLLGGVAGEHLDRLLALVDGRRTLADLQAALAAEFEPEGVAAVVRTLTDCGALAEVRETLEVDGDAPPARSVGILGGGTAGWLAALALRRHHPGVAVTLIESPLHPAIGVGEATTPLLPQFLHADLGLSPRDLFAAVRPTLKLGIHFDWGRPATAEAAPFDYPFGPLHVADALAHDGGVATASLGSLLMQAGKVPTQADGDLPSLDFGTAVAYHLDNRRFVAWLQEQGVAAGVEHVEATVADAVLTDDGRAVRELVADDGRRFARDLWVDASGFASRLLGDALGSPWNSFAPSLATDRAVVAAAPLDRPMPPFTRATTWDAGWCWSIPQRGESHRGYVYASAFLSDDAAAAELARRLPEAGEPRFVRFRCGRRAHFTRGNVAALGNAYGFVEPLESTALHLLIRQIGALVLAFPWNATPRRAEALDHRVASWWDYLAWFLALHYRFNHRLDTPFWRAARDGADVSAWGELIERYRERGPLSADPDFRFDAPDPLWGADGIDLLLAGQGVEPGPFQPPSDASTHRARLAEQHRTAAGALTQDDLLAALDRHPELANALAAPFRAYGPAFAPAASSSTRSSSAASNASGSSNIGQ